MDLGQDREHLWFRNRPPVGAVVTVLPLDVKIAPIELRIVRSQEKETRCNPYVASTARLWWEVELEPVQQEQFFEAASPERRAESPFDVALLYPRVKSARQIPNEQLTRDMLPEDVVPNTVRAAIDTTGGHRPDVVIVKHCCTDPHKRPAECDLTCGKTYRKTNNNWALVGTSAPC
jgi:hypothetical protein